MPGGGGALSASDRDVFRAQQLRGECKYLVELHQVKQIILLFHGPAHEGPAEAVCADYRRKLPWATPDVLAQRQARDAIELSQLRAEWAAMRPSRCTGARWGRGTRSRSGRSTRRWSCTGRRGESRSCNENGELMPGRNGATEQQILRFAQDDNTTRTASAA